MDDRITPYKDGGRIDERIDEIVVSIADVHIEMMGNDSAWMRIGDEVFWVHAKKNKLVIRHGETRQGYSTVPAAIRTIPEKKNG